jgi:hypothetical protein
VDLAAGLERYRPEAIQLQLKYEAVTLRLGFGAHQEHWLDESA